MFTEINGIGFSLGSAGEVGRAVGGRFFEEGGGEVIGAVKIDGPGGSRRRGSASPAGRTA